MTKRGGDGWVDRPFELEPGEEAEEELDQAMSEDPKSEDHSGRAEGEAEHQGDRLGAEKDASKGESEEGPAEGAETEEEGEDLQARYDELYQRFVRLAADFENYRKRVEKEKLEYVKFANERLLRDLLQVMDNLERALDAIGDSKELKPIRDGISLVQAELRKVLERHGVERVETVGKPFDPSVHEAFQTSETEEVPPNTVLEEVQAGYKLHGRVLRPALVVVSAAPEITSPGTKLSAASREEGDSDDSKDSED